MEAVRKVKLLRLCNVPMLHQLHLEEALLRHSPHNWLITSRRDPSTAVEHVARHSMEPTIVLGVSGKIERLINVDYLKQLRSEGHPVHVIRRFSGGGTVVINEQQFFTSLIVHGESFLGTPPGRLYPGEVMDWTGTFFNGVFSNGVLNHPSLSFELKENDYIIGDKKIAGNAQYITAGRALHHTSWLYSFNEKYMKLLSLPEKRPKYREERDHSSFLTKLEDLLSPEFQSHESLECKVIEQMEQLQNVELEESSYDESLHYMENMKTFGSFQVEIE